MEEMTKDNKRTKISEGIWSKLSRDYVIQVKNVGKKRMQGKSEPWPKELLIDGNMAIKGMDNQTILVEADNL